MLPLAKPDMTALRLAKPDLSGREAEYLADCIASGYVTHAGEYEERFERVFRERSGRAAVATSSGTGALHIALLTLGIGPGDEVIIPDLTFAAPASVVLAVGAQPVFVDVRADNWCIDWGAAKRAITPRTAAIISVDLYGEEAGLDPGLPKFLPVIQDACEGLGYTQPVGDFVCYSFYGNKVITTGEGGMLLCRYQDDIARAYRDGGFDERYYHHYAGLNYRMSNMQAALGCAQFERFDEILERRGRSLAVYRSRLKGRGHWLFVADVASPLIMERMLRECGIETRPVFYPLHLQPPFRTAGRFPNAERAWSAGLCLPTGTHVTADDAHRICDLIKEKEHATRDLRRSPDGNGQLASPG